MVTKIEAAKRQLEVAIKLFFEGIDNLSSYALASASREITDDIFDRRQDEIHQREMNRHGSPKDLAFSFREEFRMKIEPGYYKEAKAASRMQQNFLKHADKDPNAMIDEIDRRFLSLTLMFAIRNYKLVSNEWTPAMALFFAWFTAENPTFMKGEPEDSYDKRVIDKFRQALSAIPNEEISDAMLWNLQTAAPHLFPRKRSSTGRA